MRGWGAVLLVLLLVGCSKRPEGIPAPDPGWFAGFKDGCPDLRGTYTFQHAGGKRQRFLGVAIERALDKVPDHHGVWSIDAIDDQQIVLSSWSSTEDTHTAFKEWRREEPYQYALWAGSLVARQAVGGLRLERDPRKVRVPPPMLTQQLTTSISNMAYACEKGWVVFSGDEMPDVDHMDRGEVRMTRARDGGLVAVTRYKVRQSFSIWCGDGCKPDIDLGEGEREYWWHAAPAPAAEITPIDWAKWVANDDRPLAAREMYHDGVFMPYQTQEQRDARLLAKKYLSGAMDEVPAPAPDASVAMCAPLTRKLGEQVAGALDITRVQCTARRCTLEGHADTRSRVSDTMRAMDQGGVRGVDLAVLEQTREGQRFVLNLDHDCAE